MAVSKRGPRPKNTRIHRTQVSVSIDPRLLDRIDTFCERRGLTRAGAIALWASKGLDAEDARTP